MDDPWKLGANHRFLRKGSHQKSWCWPIGHLYIYILIYILIYIYLYIYHRKSQAQAHILTPWSTVDYHYYGRQNESTVVLYTVALCNVPLFNSICFIFLHLFWGFHGFATHIYTCMCIYIYRCICICIHVHTYSYGAIPTLILFSDDWRSIYIPAILVSPGYQGLDRNPHILFVPLSKVGEHNNGRGGHQPIHRDLYTHWKDSHSNCGMDDHTTYSRWIDQPVAKLSNFQPKSFSQVSKFEDVAAGFFTVVATTRHLRWGWLVCFCGV